MLRIYKSISFFLIILVSFFSIKPKLDIENFNNSVNEQKENNNKDDKKERPEDIKNDPVDDNKGFKPLENKEVTSSEPLISSNRYHEGFEKRLHSSLYTYEPIIRRELPTMHIYTPDGSNEFATKELTIYTKADEPDTECKISVSHCEEEFKFSQLKGVIKQRGNGTLNSPKKQFKLKFNEKVNVLGINNGNKFKSYILNGGGQEHSTLRDRTASYLGKQLFNYDNLYTTDMVPLDLYFNNEYWGVYFLQEKQQVNKHRVNIDDVEDREPKGSYTGTDIGYFFEYDGYGILGLDNPLDDEPVITIDYHNNDKLITLSGRETYISKGGYLHNNDELKNEFTMHSSLYSQKQKDFITHYVDRVYDILYEAVHLKRYYEFDKDYKYIRYMPDSNSFETANKVIDINSFVDMYILQEICMNSDAAWSSQYMQVDMSKKGNKKLAWTALWDNDYSFGARKATATRDYENTEVLYVSEINNPWHLLLIHTDWFWDLVKAKWAELIEQGVLYNSLHYIDEFKITYTYNFRNSFDRWFSITKSKLAGGQSTGLKSVSNHEEAANHLFNWLARRYNFLNTVFGDGTKLFNYAEDNIYG